MKIIMLSTDAKILQKDTEVRDRMIEYSQLFEELHIVVSGCGERQKINNLFIYPTNHRSKLMAFFLMHKISKALGGMSAISSQDPFELGLVAYLLKKKLKIPLQLQVHTDFMSPYFWHESLKNKIRVMIAKWLLPKADGIRVVSGRIKNSLCKILNFVQNDKISILPIFVDVEKIKSAPIKIDLHKKYPQFDFIILMASRLSAEKNIGLAIEAMTEVIKKHPKAGLVIVGEGPEVNNQKSIINNQNLENSIKIESWNDDLASYYKSSDLFLLTSLYEGYGRTIVEAMAGGLPIIMTDVGLAGDIIKDGENGFIISQFDKRGLAERVSQIISDKKMREKFSENNLKLTKEAQSKKEYLEQYKSILEKLKK